MKYLRPIKAVVGTEEVEVIEWQPEYDPLTLQPIFGASKGFFVVSGPDGPEAMVSKGVFAKPGTKFIVNPDGSIVPLTMQELAALKPLFDAPDSAVMHERNIKAQPTPVKTEILSPESEQTDAVEKAKKQSSKKSES